MALVVATAKAFVCEKNLPDKKIELSTQYFFWTVPKRAHFLYTVFSHVCDAILIRVGVKLYTNK